MKSVRIYDSDQLDAMEAAKASADSLQRVVRTLAEELWGIGYAEKCRVNGVKPTMKFYDEDFEHAQKMAWLKIADHILKMKRPNDPAQ